jgi:hypothetical protein
MLNKIITCRRSGGRSTISYGLATNTNGPGAHIPDCLECSDYCWYSTDSLEIFQSTSEYSEQIPSDTMNIGWKWTDFGRCDTSALAIPQLDWNGMYTNVWCHSYMSGK